MLLIQIGLEYDRTDLIYFNLRYNTPTYDSGGLVIDGSILICIDSNGFKWYSIYSNNIFYFSGLKICVIDPAQKNIR